MVNVLMVSPTAAVQLILPDGTRQFVPSGKMVSVDEKYSVDLQKIGFRFLEDAKPAGRYTFEDDFLHTAPTIPTSAENGYPWISKIVGAAPPTVTNVADIGGGVVRCALTATSEKQGATLYMADQRLFDVTKGAVFEARFALSTLPTAGSKAVIGLAGDWADGHDTIAQSIWIAADGSGALVAETDDGTTDNNDIATGVTLTAGTFVDILIDVGDVNDIKFYLDGVRVASGTTFRFAATGADAILQPFMEIYKASGTSVGACQADFMKVSANRA